MSCINVGFFLLVPTVAEIKFILAIFLQYTDRNYCTNKSPGKALKGLSHYIRNAWK